MCLKKRTHTHTISLSLTHKRPERRQPRKYVGCKSRELVVVKTKHSERWSKGKSVLTLVGITARGCVRVRVWVCERVCACIVSLLHLSVCACTCINVSVCTSSKKKCTLCQYTHIKYIHVTRLQFQIHMYMYIYTQQVAQICKQSKTKADKSNIMKRGI